LRTAERNAHYRPVRRRLTYGIAAGLLAAFAIAAGWRSVTAWHRPPTTMRLPTATPDPAVAARRDFTPVSPPLIAIRDLSREAVQRVGLQQGEAGFLREASAVAPARAAMCGGDTIDLNARGALAALRVRNPTDYARITGIIAGLTQHPETDVARWIAVRFHARDVSYVPLWRTSLPPQRLLSLCLENVRYSVLLTIAPSGARVSPTGLYRTLRAPGR
jgi:hypothetical protein